MTAPNPYLTAANFRKLKLRMLDQEVRRLFGRSTRVTRSLSMSDSLVPGEVATREGAGTSLTVHIRNNLLIYAEMVIGGDKSTLGRPPLPGRQWPVKFRLTGSSTPAALRGR